MMPSLATKIDEVSPPDSPQANDGKDPATQAGVMALDHSAAQSQEVEPLS